MRLLSAAACTFGVENMKDKDKEDDVDIQL